MSKYNLDFLESYNETTLGPIQKGEALFLFGLCEMVRPQIVLEVGCLIGQSLRVWMESGVPFVYAVDCIISNEVKEIRRAKGSNRVELIEQDMKEPVEFTRGVPDLVFVDASHELPDNIQLVKNLLPVLKPGALFILHDTGHWHDKDMTDDRHLFIKHYGGYQDKKTKLWVHSPGEKETIAWISKNTKWERVDLWTTAVARYGLTIFQVK